MTGWLPPRENWRTGVICVLIFGAFALAGHWDAQDASLEWAQSDVIEQAAREAAHQQRIERAARAMCGPQASATWIDQRTVQCTPRRDIRPYRVAAGDGEAAR